MYVTLIVNPASGGETAVDHLPMMRRRLGEAVAGLKVVVTRGEGDATAAGRQAVLDGFERLLAGRPHAVDVGRLNGRCFLNISAGGFIAEVSEAVPSKLKTVLGKLAYLVG